MTLIVSWVGVDTHGTSSAYIASDSRVSWGKSIKFDACRKLFTSKKYPEIIGYCGDVLFPSLILSSLIDMIDADLLFTPNDKAIVRFEKFRNALCERFANYPTDSQAFAGSVEIVYINKEIQENGYPEFYCHKIICKPKSKFSFARIEIPKKSGVLITTGSGKAEFENNYEKKFKKTKNSNTSRNVFHCYCYTLKQIVDSSCGGSPQLVGIYRKPKDTGKTFGVIYRRCKYYNGMRIKIHEFQSVVEWRNIRFERCNGKTGKILENAQSQPVIITQ